MQINLQFRLKSLYTRMELRKHPENQNKPDCPFMIDYCKLHSRDRSVKVATDDEFIETEKIFLSIFQIGISEAYQFLYQRCNDVADFEQWLLEKRGPEEYNQAIKTFNRWYYSEAEKVDVLIRQPLNAAQLKFWKDFGYLQVSEMVSAEDCDAVVTLMCEVLSVNLADDSTWHMPHEQLQGMMLVRYQDEAIAKIRKNEKISAVFSQLYHKNVYYPNTEKLSYNPPENNHYRFMGSPLHWDCDFDRGVSYYIQGLVYLDDVPADRGPLTLIPGFHHEIDQFLQGHSNPHAAMEVLRNEARQIPVPGKKGDLILWLEALPHAASANKSNKPRFVQYVSYNKP